MLDAAGVDSSALSVLCRFGAGGNDGSDIARVLSARRETHGWQPA